MNLKVTLNWAHIKNEIDYETYKAAEITITDDPVVKGEAQSDNTNADADFCRAKIETAIATLEEVMHKHYLTTSLEEADNELNRVRQNWVLNLIYGDSERRVINLESLTAHCHRYVVDYVLYEWCKLALPTLTEGYMVRMQSEESAIGMLINRKEAPTLFDEDTSDTIDTTVEGFSAEIVSVETLEAGEQAEVDITVERTTSPDGSVVPSLLFTFKLPQGTKGEKGDQGIQGIQGIQGVQGVPGTVDYDTVYSHCDAYIRTKVNTAKTLLIAEVEAKADALDAKYNTFTGNVSSAVTAQNGKITQVTTRLDNLYSFIGYSVNEPKYGTLEAMISSMVGSATSGISGGTNVSWGTLVKSSSAAVLQYNNYRSLKVGDADGVDVQMKGNYITKEYFSTLFSVENIGTTSVPKMDGDDYVYKDSAGNEWLVTKDDDGEVTSIVNSDNEEYDGDISTLTQVMISVQKTAICAKKDFYSLGGVTALGKGSVSGGSSSGSGVTLNSLLYSLNNANPNMPSSKQYLYCNNGNWGFDTISPGSSFTPNTLVSKLNETVAGTGYLYYNNGWSFTSGTGTSSSSAAWTDITGRPSWLDSYVSSAPNVSLFTNDANYATQNWVEQQNFVYHSQISGFKMTLWGADVYLGGTRSGDMSNVGSISLSAHDTYSIGTTSVGVRNIYAHYYSSANTDIDITPNNNSNGLVVKQSSNYVGIGTSEPKGKLHVDGSIYLNSALYQQKSGDNYLNVLNLEGGTNLILGAGAYTDNTIKSYVRGNEITMQLAIANTDMRDIASFSGVDGNNIMELIGYGSKSAALKIGDAYIKYDSVNECLFVDDGKGGAMNFAATGGVTALGVNRGAIGSLTNLTVTNQATASIVSTNKLWVQPYNSSEEEDDTINTIDIGRWDDNEGHYLDLINLMASTVKCSEDLDVVGTLTCDAISGTSVSANTLSGTTISGTSVSANSIALSEKIKVGSSGTEIKQISIDSSNKIMSITVGSVTYKVAMTV